MSTRTDSSAPRPNPRPNPRPSLRSFWTDLPREGRLLLSVVAFEFVGHGLVLPFWVVYLHEVRGFTLDTTGLIIAVEPLVGLLAVGPTGVLIDRFGARLVMLVALVSAVVGETVIAFSATVPMAVVGMALMGLSFGVLFPASQTLVATVVPPGIRQRYFGVNFTLLNLGIGLGGLIGGAYVDVERLVTFQVVYLIDAVSFLPSLFILGVLLRHVTGRPEHDEDDASPAGYREVLRIPGMPTLLLLTFVGSFVAYAQLNSGLPAFGRNVSHVSTQALGLAFAANTLVIVLLQLVVLQRIEGRRRTRVMMVMAGVWALAWALMGISGLLEGTLAATLLIVACASVFAFGETLLQPTMPAIVNDLATDRLRGRTNAISSAAFQLPMVLAPPVTGWLLANGLAPTYIGLLLVGCLALVGMAAVLEKRIPASANGVLGGVEGAGTLPPTGPPTPVGSVPETPRVP